jgi:3-hydroxymyristoyl/3-hydroxydecanoyl-(acyl carrier protein) dehydratase
MAHVLNLEFASDYPSAIGHFPGNPIIPGAALLSDVVMAICNASGVSVESFAISSAKFLHIVRPGDNVAVSWQKRSDDEVEFDCRLDGTDKVVLRGLLKGGEK